VLSSGRPNLRVVPPEIPGHQGCGTVGYEFDPAAAQEYLQAALDEMGLDDPADTSFNLWSNTGYRHVMQAVAGSTGFLIQI
jgi:hypothetical protein